MAQNPHRRRSGGRRAASKTGTVPIGAKILTQHGPSSGSSAKKLAQQAQKRQIWGVLSAQGELFRAEMKPPPPLLTRSRAHMKPATPLLAHNATKTHISGEQR